jgi:ribosome-associated heat shock protein Hsp15
MVRSPRWRPCASTAPAHDLVRGRFAIPDQEDRDWQRLDKWLWCARVMRARSDCAALVGQGGIRINRQPTDKAHARLRVGDVVTLPVHGEVRVLRVLALAARRGPATEARLLCDDLSDPQPSCAGTESSAYRPL